MDDPLAPLPDEPEVVEVDEDDQEEARNESTQQKEVEMDDRPLEIPPSPKPQLTLTQSSSVSELNHDPALGLDAMDTGVVDDKKGLELDISGLGPDGLQLGEMHDLSQLTAQDSLLGDPLMDGDGDPFAAPTS